MSSSSRVEWTDATWNPVKGCTKVSAGCAFCYAEVMANRLRGAAEAKFFAGKDVTQTESAYMDAIGDNGRWTGDIFLDDSVLHQPLRWRRPRKIFTCSMSDLWHEDLPYSDLARVYGVMAKAERHTFQVLTKRAEFRRNARSGHAACLKVLPNVWEGTSVESIDHVARIRHLAQTPAAVRFLSCEPLLGDLGELDLTGIDWVIVGGESGHGARPMHPDWARSIRDQCQEQDVAFFFKQWGAHWPTDQGCGSFEFAPRQLVRSGEQHWLKVGKRQAGCVLDGQIWRQFPEVEP